MLCKPYYCDTSKRHYEDYYMAQGGYVIPIFEGYHGQRGHGLGSILSGLFRSAVPLIRRGLAFFGKQALKTGAQIANDVAEGQSFHESTKKRVSERINEYVPGLIPQSGSGIRRTKIKRCKRKKVKKDIFDH